MSQSIAPIVEGQSEAESVPILLRRIIRETLSVSNVEVVRPFRVKRNRIAKEGQLERAIKMTLRDRADVGAILVLLDADDDCPAHLGPQLLQRAQSATRIPVGVVLATRETEAWFLGAKESLRGIRGIRADAEAPPNPETIRGAKEHLSRNMEGRRYLPVDDQAALAAEFDISAASGSCPSFRRLVAKIGELVERMHAEQ